MPLRDPLGILRAELEEGEAEIREMRFGTRRLRLLEMRGSAGTWLEAKINPESYRPLRLPFPHFAVRRYCWDRANQWE